MSKELGGFFEEKVLPPEENGFFRDITPAGGELRFLMSGRCAIFCALNDLKIKDRKRVAYVPAYTCGTVLAAYVKAGYRLKFYDVDEKMTPVWEEAALDEISALNLCGYYGFSAYDRGFVKRCKERGICVLEDATHSILSLDGIDPDADYIAGSMRKWIAVPSGGFLIKREGRLAPGLLPFDKEHVMMRKSAMRMKRRYLENLGGVQGHGMDEATAAFWHAEHMLRQMFDCYGSDPDSEWIMTHFETVRDRKARRGNYGRLLEAFPVSPACVPVFPKLDESTVPSHFTVFAERRDELKAFLETQDIHTTAYWSKSLLVDDSRCPHARYIYSHVLSLPCDQRYEAADMERIALAVESFIS